MRTHRTRLSKQLFITVGEHHASHGAQDVPGGHPAQDHRARAQGEIHRKGVHHQPHLLDTGGDMDIKLAISRLYCIPSGGSTQFEPLLRVLELQREDHHL